MEKNNSVGYTTPYSFNLSLTMKLTTILLILSIFTVQANSYAQKTKVTLDLRQVEMQKVFEEIESLTDFKFLYDNTKIDGAKLVSVKVDNKPISAVLDNLFKGTSIYYLVRNKQIVLKVQTNPMPSKTKEESKVIEEVKPVQHILFGTITDDKGQPLPGANVVEKGTTNGVTADFDGNFSITLTEESPILIISYVGFSTLEIVVDGQTELYISLKEDAAGLEEVVVVGYGSQSKRIVTGAISSVDNSIYENYVNLNVEQSLSGVAGVQITPSLRPGQEGNLLIRGQNSLSGQNNPLIILDGSIFNGGLGDINPADIKTLDILKDASSTAIYGSRAANGVILITSKTGTTDKPLIKLNTFFGLSEQTNRIKMLSGERYIERRLDWRRQSGLEANLENIVDYLSDTEAENYLNGVSHNAFDVVGQQGQLSTIDLSISGREKFTNYYLSASLSEEKGVIYNDNQKRTTFRANISTQIQPWLKLGFDATYSHRDLSGLSADMNYTYRSSPYGTFFYPDGQPTEYPVPTEQSSRNPMRMAMLTTNEEIQDNLFSNFYTVIDLSFITGLSYRINYSPNKRWYHNYDFVRQDTYVDYNTTSGSKFNQGNFDWLFENILNYKRKFGNDHSLDITLLYSRNHSEMETTTANSDLFSIDVLGYNNLALGSVPTNTSYAQQTDGVSYMGRLNYQLKGKYLLTATLRRDGSSVFAANNKYANFPSGAVGWIVSDESFMDNVNFVENLKLRASYGAVGNQAIAPYQSLSLSALENYVFGDGGPTSLGVVNSTLGNDNLKWETTYSTNIGIDYSLFNGRLGGALEFYNNNTEDLLVRRSIPVMNGFQNVLSNIGKVNNKGIEMSLNSVNVEAKAFKWTSNFNIAYNKNTIKSLYGNDLDNDGKEDDDIGNSWFIDQPINSYFDYVFDGIYQDGDVDIPAGSAPGYVRAKDINGDSIINAEDRAIVGSGENPEYQISLRNDFKVKGFTLSVFMNSMIGWEAPFNVINPGAPSRAIGQMDNGWWTPENESNTRPSLLYNNPLRTNWYVSRDFLRIQDISLSYDFDQILMNKIGLSNLRLFLSAKNVYTWTNWLGPDPESGGSYPAYSTQDFYPLARTVALGVNISF
ncbi:TonB-dependent receptor [Arenibacter palladensis]|uniref:TonB-dependent receptor n=1 Tax=Arenibacter palladensis TaxID=237373 RepID=UPI0026E2B8DF|nr:TonB-dependent receptor [Arenibacter palladensis]MDO6603955.1 TonB-dependent receptor [Arenibacter palladensis]